MRRMPALESTARKLAHPSSVPHSRAELARVELAGPVPLFRLRFRLRFGFRLPAQLSPGRGHRDEIERAFRGRGAV